MSDELIERLVLELEPVKRLGSAARRSARFGGLALATTAASVWLLGLRADLALRLCDPSYLTESGLLGLLFAFATLAALRSGVPGAELRSLGWLVTLAGAGWCLEVAISRASVLTALFFPSGLACLRRTLLLGVVPAGWLLLLLRRSAPVDRRASGSLAMVSVGALAILGTRCSCAKDDAAHVLAWHVTPLALLALGGWLMGPAWLSRPADGIGARRGPDPGAFAGGERQSR